jgi:hypothetical protein
MSCEHRADAAVRVQGSVHTSIKPRRTPVQVNRTRALILGSALGHVLDQLWKCFAPILREIKPVHGLGEAQVGVDAGNDYACIDG